MPRIATSGHGPGGRQRHPPAPDHSGDKQAAAAGVRQADGLLPVENLDAGLVLVRVDHDHRYHYPQRTGAGSDALQHRFQALYVQLLLAHFLASFKDRTHA